MNATYKVVFNKARRALMVVNEITSIVQSKGSKTVVAAAVAAVLAGVTGTAIADDSAPVAPKTTIVIDGSATDAMLLKYSQMDFEGYVSKPFGKDEYESGAVYMSNSRRELIFKEGVKFVNNTSERAGGAIEVQNSRVVLQDAVITGNQADTWGGAFRIAGNSRLSISVTKDTVYSDNRANANGKEPYPDMGGFAYLNGTASGNGHCAMHLLAKDDEGNDVSLTIMDSIASSGSGNEIRTDGNVTVTGSMEAYTGDIVVSSGTFKLAGGFGSYDLWTASNLSETGGQMNSYATSALYVKEGAKAELGDLRITRTNLVDKNDPAPLPGTKLVVDQKADLTVNSITVTSQRYSSNKPNDKTEFTSHGWGSLTVFNSGEATIKDHLTIEAGGRFTLGGNANVGRLNIAAGDPATQIDDGKLELGKSTELTLNSGLSTNKGLITGKDKGKNTLIIGENASLINEGRNETKSLSISGTYTSRLGYDENGKGSLADGYIKLSNNGKFILTNEDVKSIAVTGVDFLGGNFYTDENTIFKGNLTVGRKAGFTGTYTFNQIDTKGLLNVIDGTVTVNEGINSGDTGKVEVSPFGTLSVSGEKIGFKTTDGIVSLDKADLTVKEIANKGTLIIRGLEGEMTAANLAAANSLLVGTYTGMVDYGTLKVTDLENQISDNKIAYKDIKELHGVSLDQLKNVTVTDVPDNTAIQGSYGSLVFERGTPSSQGGLVKHAVLELNGSGLIASDADGNAVKLTVVRNSEGNGTLRTTGEGAFVGEIAGESGVYGILEVASGSLSSASYKLPDGTTKYYGTALDTLRVAENASFESLGSVSLFNQGLIAGSAKIGELNVLSNRSSSVNTPTDILEIAGTAEIDKLMVADNPVLITGTANINELLSGRVNVGNDKKAGNAVFDTVKGTVFADPAWENSTVSSTVAVNTVAAGGVVEVGQNSIGVVGSTDIEKAKDALASTGYVIAPTGPKAVNSAVLVLGQKDAGAAVAIAGDVYASNATLTTGPSGAITGTAAGSLMIIDVSSLGTGSAAVFDKAFTNSGTLFLTNFKPGESFTLTSDTLTNTGAVETEGGRLLGVTISGSTFTVDVDTAKVAGFADLRTIGTIVDMYKTGAYSSRSGAFNKWLIEGNPTLTDVQVVAIGNDAAMLGATAAAGSVTMDTLSAFNDTVANRTSILTPRCDGVNVWADVYGGHNEANKLMDGRGYKSDVYGGTLGVDGSANGFTVGAALTISTGDTDSTNTLVNSTTDSDFVGLSIYGSKASGDLNVTADLGYLHSANDVSVKSFGINDFSADTDAFTLGVRGEYLIETGNFKVVPHIGLRYTYLTTDDFEAAYTTDFDDMNVFQMPVGVTVAGNIGASGWNLTPSIDLSVVPAFGDKDANMTLGITGVGTKTAISTQIIDSNLFQMNLGLAAQKDAWTFGLNWKMNAGSDDRMNNAFKAIVNYTF